MCPGNIIGGVCLEGRPLGGVPFKGLPIVIMGGIEGIPINIGFGGIKFGFRFIVDGTAPVNLEGISLLGGLSPFEKARREEISAGLIVCPMFESKGAREG